MRKTSKLRPSPAMAVAFAALFVAGAGGATAASSLIDGGDVRNNSLTGGDVRNNSLTGRDVKNGSLLRRDFKRGQLPAGARGPQGLQGVSGPAGRAGRDGFGKLAYSQGIGDPVAPGETGDDVFAVCPAGTFPTGGDAFYVDADGDLVASQPVLAQGIAVDLGDVPAAWIATPSENQTAGAIELVVDAICANASDLDFVSTSQTAKRKGIDRPDRLRLSRP